MARRRNCSRLWQNSFSTKKNEVHKETALTHNNNPLLNNPAVFYAFIVVITFLHIALLLKYFNKNLLKIT